MVIGKTHVLFQSQNEAWGLRDTDDLEKEAKKNGMSFDAMFNMPANNKTLVWIKNEEWQDKQDECNESAGWVQ